MARDIFISYSRCNLDRVKVIKKDIEQVTGTVCWMDLNAIESGAAQFTQDIVDGIKTCRVFLFMLSKESQNSKFALRELNFAMKRAETDKQKHVVIVNIDDCNMTDEFEFMYSLTDTISWNNLPQRHKLLLDLKGWIKSCNDEIVHEQGNSVIVNDGIQPSMKSIKGMLSNKYVQCLLFLIAVGLILLFSIKSCRYASIESSIVPQIENNDSTPMLYYVKDNISGLYGFIDETGKLVIPYKWEDAFCFTEGLAGVKDTTDQYGFIDTTGTLVIPCQWKIACGFRNALAPVINEQGRWGYIDTSGKEVIPFQWATASSFCDGLAWVEDEQGLRGYIDMSGKVVIPFLWNITLDFSEGLAAVCDQASSNWGFIDKTGKLVIPYMWMYADSFSNGLACVMDGHGNHYYIDKTGNVVISCEGEYAWSFSEGLVVWESNTGRYGYVDTNGKTVIPCQWKCAKEFSEGLAAVLDNNNKWGYIDKFGKLVIPCKWKEADAFIGALAPVTDTGGRRWWIDKAGKVIGEK